jgi:hypothetical protein
MQAALTIVLAAAFVTLLLAGLWWAMRPTQRTPEEKLSEQWRRGR